MKNQSKKLVFWGSGLIGARSLEALVSQEWQIVAVITKPSKATTRKSTVNPVEQTAKSHGLSVFYPEKIDHDFISTVKNFGARISVLASYGKILPKEILNLFPLGIVNVHPSLLPKYRGPSPIETVILNGDHATGVTLIKLTEKMDAGPIYAQEKIEIDNTQNQETLYNLLSKLGAELLVKSLPDIVDGLLLPKPQEETNASYTKMLKKTDGQIDWMQPAEQIERQIRAYINWPKSHTKLLEKDVIITKSKIIDKESQNKPPGKVSVTKNSIIVQANPGELEILELKPVGKSTMSSSEFIRGLRL